MAGVDSLDISLDESRKEVSNETQAVFFENGRLEEHTLKTTLRELTLDNRASLPRTAAYVLDGVVRNATVQGADATDYDPAAEHALAFIDVPARRTVERTLTIRQALEVRHVPSRLEPKTLQRLTSARLPDATRAVLRSALPHATAAARHDAELEALDDEIRQLNEDLTRTGGYLEASPGGRTDGDPIARRIVELERRLVRVREARATTEKHRQSAHHALEQTLQALENLNGEAPGARTAVWPRSQSAESSRTVARHR